MSAPMAAAVPTPGSSVGRLVTSANWALAKATSWISRWASGSRNAGARPAAARPPPPGHPPAHGGAPPRRSQPPLLGQRLDQRGGQLLVEVRRVGIDDHVVDPRRHGHGAGGHQEQARYLALLALLRDAWGKGEGLGRVGG